MVEVQESIIVERSRLETAFQRLHNALEKYGQFAENTANNNAAAAARSEIEGLREEVQSLNNHAAQARDEVARVTAELARLEAENKNLKELNTQVTGLLQKSITELEALAG